MKSRVQPCKPTFMETQKLRDASNAPAKKQKKKTNPENQKQNVLTVSKNQMKKNTFFNGSNPFLQFPQDIQREIINYVDPQGKLILRLTSQYFNKLINIGNQVNSFFKPILDKQSHVNQMIKNRKLQNYQLLFICQKEKSFEEIVSKWQAEKIIVPASPHATVLRPLESTFLPTLSSNCFITILVIPNNLFAKNAYNIDTHDEKYVEKSDYYRRHTRYGQEIGDRNFTFDNKYVLAHCLVSENGRVYFLINQNRDKKIDAVMTGSPNMSIHSFMPLYLKQLNERFYPDKKNSLSF